MASPITAQPDTVTMRYRCHPRRYRQLIGRCLGLIRAGQTYEVCLTNTMTVEGTVDPIHAFRRMPEINPAPFASLLEFDDASVISASPGRFLRITADRTAESKPIKDTRPRGCTADEDDALRRGLLTGEKERAENLMIVDLVRNDLKRVCMPGSVHVSTLFEGETMPPYINWSPLFAHPAAGGRRDRRGSCPVSRRVDDRSPEGAHHGNPGSSRGQRARGDSGAIGYFSLSGTADLSIAIRTIVSTGARAEFGVGGAITAFSDSEAEYQETLVKAAALQTALQSGVGATGLADSAVALA
jgi:para-aminobenzoate synthetase